MRVFEAHAVRPVEAGGGGEFYPASRADVRLILGDLE